MIDWLIDWFVDWLTIKGHYEFCHFDPDDNFLVMIQGRKQVRSVDLSIYPSTIYLANGLHKAKIK